MMRSLFHNGQMSATHAAKKTMKPISWYVMLVTTKYVTTNATVSPPCQERNSHGFANSAFKKTKNFVEKKIKRKQKKK